MNSAIITITSTILTIALSSMAAYVLVRNKWKACGALFGMMIASMVIPFQVLMIPIVSLYGGVLGLLSHRATLIFMHVGFLHQWQHLCSMVQLIQTCRLPLKKQVRLTVVPAGRFTGR